MSALMMVPHRRRASWFLSGPMLIFMALIALFPLLYGAYQAFQARTLMNPHVSWAGLANFRDVLTDPALLHAFIFSIVFTVATVVIELLLGSALALLLDRGFPGRRVVLTLALLPIMVASSLMAVLWRLVLNPDIGSLPGALGLFGIKIDFLSPQWTTPAVIMADALHWTPFVMLLIYGGLQGVPGDLYEAASMDGAGYWRTIWSVVLPVLRPVIVVTLVLRVIDAFKTFDIIYVLTGGGPGSQTTNVNIYVYKTAFEGGDFGAAAAASLVILAVLALAIPYVTKRLTRG